MVLCFKYEEHKTGISYSYCVREFYVRGDTITIFDDSDVKYVIKSADMGRAATHFYPYIFYQDIIPKHKRFTYPLKPSLPRERP